MSKAFNPISTALSESDPSKKSKTHVVVGDETYTTKQCIEDIITHSESCPNASVSRNYYRQNSEIPESAWGSLFGTFSEFKRQAGLQPTRYQTKILNHTARMAAGDEFKAFSQDRKNYGDKYQKHNDKRFKTLIVGSDMHDTNIDLFYRRMFMTAIEQVQPDVINFAGDIFDFPEISRFNVDVRDWDFVGRWKYGLGIIEEARNAAPDAQIDFVEGNHEARFLRHFHESTQVLQVFLSEGHGFNISRLLKLDEYEVNYIATADLTKATDAQVRREVTEKNYIKYWGCFLVCHFPTAKNQHNMPGVNGHHHKHVVDTLYTGPLGSYEWHQLGSGHRRDANYTDGLQWNNGFAIVHIDTLTGEVVFDYVDVGSTMAVVGGQIYYREEDEFFPSLLKELDERRYQCFDGIQVPLEEK